MKLHTCTFEGCSARVIPSRMADHWVIAQHYTPNLPAKRAALGDAPYMVRRAHGLTVRGS